MIGRSGNARRRRESTFARARAPHGHKPIVIEGVTDYLRRTSINPRPTPSMLKEDTFRSRQDTSRDAKQKLLERFRSAAEDPVAQKRKAERAVIAQAREARLAQKAAEQERLAAIEREKQELIAAENRRIAEEEEARRAAAEAVRRQSQPKPVSINAAAHALASLMSNGGARKAPAAANNRDPERKTA
ncbi:DUF6481 family protein [Hansschlegelia sp. KR7-227]|uniref:DUF6481 family protein n=1 Tax=Hansschlegelia sp. KR7-227 TaxID=3400914 RepID=UPI003BFD6853